MKTHSLFIMLLLSIFIFDSCKTKTKPILPVLSEKQGTFVAKDSSLIDSVSTGIVEIWKENDSFTIYRSVRPKQVNDLSQIMSSPDAGTWSTITVNKIYRFTKGINPVLIIPFKKQINCNLMNTSYNDCCCQCSDRNGCCVTYLEGNVCFCDKCAENNPCSGACTTIRDIANPYKGSVWFFYADGFTGNNFKVINQ